MRLELVIERNEEDKIRNEEKTVVTYVTDKSSDDLKEKYNELK